MNATTQKILRWRLLGTTLLALSCLVAMQMSVSVVVAQAQVQADAGPLQTVLAGDEVMLFGGFSTGTITTIEYEPGLMKDLPRALQKIAPKGEHYDHHETWHDDNGHSHVRASLMGPSISIPIRNGSVIHGTWQQIVFVEFDTRPRNRNIIVQIIGE